MDVTLRSAALEPHRDALAGVVVESTYNGYWLVDGLQDHGYTVHLANTSAIRQYEGLKYTDDESDARWLATLLRLGMLPEGHIYPRKERGVRDLVRKRSQLVRHHTAHLLSIENLILRNTGRRITANDARVLTPKKKVFWGSNEPGAASGFSLRVRSASLDPDG